MCACVWEHRRTHRHTLSNKTKKSSQRQLRGRSLTYTCVHPTAYQQGRSWNKNRTHTEVSKTVARDVAGGNRLATSITQNTQQSHTHVQSPTAATTRVTHGAIAHNKPHEDRRNHHWPGTQKNASTEYCTAFVRARRGRFRDLETSKFRRD